MTAKYPKTDELLTAINSWARPLVDHPSFRQLLRSKIRSAMDWEDDWLTEDDGVSEIVLPEPLAAQHEVVLRFYNLWATAERSKSVEFYFRRYPFNGLPVNRHEHLGIVCEILFNNAYVFEERLKVYLNALNKTSAHARIDVGNTLKLYQKHFKSELRERHNSTHLEPFDDLTMNAVMLRSMPRPDSPLEDRLAGTYAYRKASREWARRARRFGERLAAFLEAVADASLTVAIFLQTPPSPAPGDLRVL